MSYIIDSNEFKKSKFYSPMMECKLYAIEKYLSTNFDTDEKVHQFFKEFCDKYLSIKKDEPILKNENIEQIDLKID